MSNFERFVPELPLRESTTGEIKVTLLVIDPHRSDTRAAKLFSAARAEMRTYGIKTSKESTRTDNHFELFAHRLTVSVKFKDTTALLILVNWINNTKHTAVSTERVTP